ncbi:PEP-CTERM sorting domain-containing protein [Chamaesiphon sp. VAR_48_metabat_135_sub]|jgi:hypothetical protein|uniref:PEP-CTERM sorting domain-containing protein n=1 Tax=Chamaesiphon sp. VAR_48_metabat_135_sub TaxID=2964699 RepID=UPI00286D2A69|nr:PEP-CTERM sorting domain-containing protein [Chamaesiphon sp. VAR_48_metabat_135_sub]
MSHLLQNITKVACSVASLSLLAIVFPLSASAVTTTYTNSTTFLNNTSTTYLETFDSLPLRELNSPKAFSQSGFAYTVSAPNRLWVGSGIGNTGSPFVGTQNPNDNLTISFTSGNVTAIGGNFFLNDTDDNLTTGIIKLTLDDGSFINLNSPTSAPVPFGGFTTDGSIITSLTISGPTTTWENFDNLYVGTAINRAQLPANVTDVPEPLTVLGTIFGAGYGVALKRKLAKSQQANADIT